MFQYIERIPQFSLKKYFLFITSITVLYFVMHSIFAFNRICHYQQREIDRLDDDVSQLAQQLDAVRSYALRVTPQLRSTPGRVARRTDRDGWPEDVMRISRDNFGREAWPFTAMQVTVHGTLFGLAFVEIDGELWALNGLAGMSGYPMCDIRVLRNNTATPGTDLMSIAPVRDVALRIVERLKEEHIQHPYRIP